MKEIHETHEKDITVVRLMRNFGQHNALMCGFRHARGQFIITMDDDLQNPPSEIPKLISAIEDGQLDVVYGCYETKMHGMTRNLGSFLVQAFYRLVFKSSQAVTSFRIIRREVIGSIRSYNLNYTYIDGLLAWSTQRIGQVLVGHHPRTIGRSGYSVAKLLVLAFNLFTNFSLLPLQLVSAVGFAAAVSGLAIGAYYLVQALFSAIAVPGFAATIVSIFILGGVQLLALGIMGEYLGRLHLNINRKPQYVERESISASLPERSAVPEVGTTSEPAPVRGTPVC